MLMLPTCCPELDDRRRILGAVADHVGLAEAAAWAVGLDQVHARIASRFLRCEPREWVAACLRGLLAPLRRKNGWTLAEQADKANPEGVQRLLSSADSHLDRPSAACDPDTHPGVPPGHIQPRARRLHELQPPLPPATMTMSVPGRARKIQGFVVVLKAAIHGSRGSLPPSR